MIDRMKHRFADCLVDWLRLLCEMGLISEPELGEVLDRAERKELGDVADDGGEAR